MTTRRLIQLLNALALVIAVLWLIFKPDFEPALTTCALLAALIGLIIEEKVSTSHDVDKALFMKFKDTLPSNGTISFVDENNFAGFSFERKRLHDFDNFVYTWNDAEHEFWDKQMESKRKELLGLINTYLNIIATETFTTNTPGWKSVPEEWEEEQPERFEKAVSQLHNLAGEIVAKHQSLIRLARKKLKC